MKKSSCLLAVLLLVLVAISDGQVKKESLKIMWPGEYKWKIGSNQQAQNVQMVELIPGNETLQKWSIMGTMMSMKGVKNTPLLSVMNDTYRKMKVNAPNAKLTMGDQGAISGFRYILFTIESPKFNNSMVPESQLYFVVQGGQSLYINFAAIHAPTLSKQFVSKWSNVFKASQVIQQ
jgi:hypothetical protein